MLLPNASHAYIDRRKLTDYVLNPLHEEGKHKAAVFSSVLGITVEEADELRWIILEAVKHYSADIRETDQYGQRYTVDIPCSRAGRKAVIRTAWMIRVGENFPRLTSCYVLQN